MGKVWDAFYVVLDEVAENVKFGITSGDARIRFTSHARRGYSTTVRLKTGLPPGAARSLEKAVMAALKLAGIEPIRGLEHFQAAALPVILDIADNYPIPTGRVLVDGGAAEMEEAA